MLLICVRDSPAPYLLAFKIATLNNNENSGPTYRHSKLMCFFEMLLMLFVLWLYLKSTFWQCCGTGTGGT
jgi:hypothetical protein